MAQAESAVPTPEILGYMVFIREHDHWSEDWDGTVHRTEEEGFTAVQEARLSGYDAVLVAAVRVTGAGDDR